MQSRISMLRRFISSYVGPRRGMFSVVQLLHIGAAALVIIPPLIVRFIIDEVIPGRDYVALAYASGGIVGIFALFFLFAALKEFWGHEVAQGITSRLRNDLYTHFQKLSLSFHDRTKTGELLSRIVDDINIIQEIVHHGPEAIVLALAMVSGSAALLFFLDWRLALVALAVVPVLAVYSKLTAGRMWERFREVRKRTASLADELEENLTGIHVIKAYGAEDREVDAVAAQNHGHYKSRMSVIRWMALLFPGAFFINSLGLAAVVSYGGYMAMEGLITVGTLTAFVLYLNHFLHPILRLVMMAEQAGRFFASIERFYEYMDIAPDITDEPEAHRLETTKGEIAFVDVHFKYEDNYVLEGVSFVAYPGQLVALVGPSGAGKTTITRLIPRFYEPQKGRVLVDGRDVRSVTLRSLRAHMGMVMQDDYLFSGTVSENIRYGRPEATDAEVIEAAHQANAHPFVEKLPDTYATEIGKRGIKLSEGQRQRISIARALLKNPQILLLDEATSSVDPETELLIQKALSRLRKGRTTFAIAHRLSTIIRADTILFIQDGRVLEQGSHKELMKQGGEYARFFKIQFHDMVENPVG